MKVNVLDFPYPPTTMKCCKECIGKVKDCIPNPMKCLDFKIHNYDFIKNQLEQEGWLEQ